jgi:hypothetical protein
MNTPITLKLDACTVVAQRDGSLIAFAFRCHADGAELFTITGPEFHRIVRAWNSLDTQAAIERAGQLAPARPAPPPPKPDPLTRFLRWLRADITGGANGQ